jgi:hypothetical protein
MEQSGKNSNRFVVKYCRYCRKTFEVNKYGGKRFISYYEDMPTYGLDRKPCPKHDPGDDNAFYEEKL